MSHQDFTYQMEEGIALLKSPTSAVVEDKKGSAHSFFKLIALVVTLIAVSAVGYSVSLQHSIQSLADESGSCGQCVDRFFNQNDGCKVMGDWLLMGEPTEAEILAAVGSECYNNDHDCQYLAEKTFSEKCDHHDGAAAKGPGAAANGPFHHDGAAANGPY